MSMDEYRERHILAVDRLRSLVAEETVAEQYLHYFQDVAIFLLELENVRRKIDSGAWDHYSIEEMRSINEILYSDIVGDHYRKSWANPAYAAGKFGVERGRLLSMLYAEMRSGLPYAFENRVDYLTILCELFIEVYNCFETACREKGENAVPEGKEIRDIIYWYASDYCDVFLADRILEQIDPERSFAAELIGNADLDDDRYLYRFGEYITENELGTAHYLRTLPEETLQKMADVYTEGYRTGFANTGKDLSKKSVVNIRYTLGFEKVVRLAVDNFRKMGLRPVIYRAASGVITKREHHKIGYTGAIPNWQYEYDHRQDQPLFMDKRYIERRLEVLRPVYEQHREMAARFEGPAGRQTVGGKPFSPESVPVAPAYTEEQNELAVQYDGRSGQITNEYIRGDERSFTIIAWPVPEIGEKYEEIFGEVIRINTLDAKLYEKVQQTLIDALDQGKCVHVAGKGANRTDLTVRLFRLKDPSKETIFENCVADVNIPVGEVFTSPVLEGTNGVLHVSRVFLEGLEYRDLELHFEDGMVTDYGCGNFADPEDGKKYVADNVLKGHQYLQLGDYAVGTDPNACVAGRRCGLEARVSMRIMGPHRHPGGG